MRLKDIGDKLDDIYWDLIGYRLRNFTLSVKNLIRWFPVIWKDRDWDDYYIWEVLKFKLIKQAAYISKRDRHTQAQYDAQRMRLCARLIEKVRDEYYQMEYADYYDIKTTFTECFDRPDSYEMKTETTSENFDDYLNKYKASVRKVLADKSLQVFKLDRDDYKRHLAMNVGRYNEMKAQDLLFKLLNRDIRGWWD
jgi:hypothetical protein